MTKTEPDGELSFLSLVVKETSTGVYSYIMKTRPDTEWISTQTGQMNMGNYTGDIILYTAEGVYVHKTTFNAGVAVTSEDRHPCSTAPPNSNSGSNGSDNTGNNTSGNSGGGGGSCVFQIMVIRQLQNHLISFFY